MYPRQIQLAEILTRKSLFLLGPRQTGKSTLLRERFPQALYIDLLEADTFRELSVAPESLRQRLEAQGSHGEQLVIIDEIQKLPSILDEVQLLIDRHKQLRFIMTGSSARKLKRGGANLLGGRAHFMYLHPLVSPELNYARIVERINKGGLPAIIDSPEPRQDLSAYVGTYLKEEILAESLTRSIENFSRVLHFAAHLNGQQVNYTKIGNDAQVAPRTVRDYFQLLEDTLIAHLLPPFRQTSKRKAVATEKFYLFDNGVAQSLARKGKIEAGTTDFGQALEHLIYLELLAYRDYNLLDFELTYWRSQSQLEVDFLIDKKIAIEVKATGRVTGRDLKGLRALAEEVALRRQIVVCGESQPRIIDGVEVIPYEHFLRQLWQGKIYSAKG